jgi:hypothetical protein
MNEGYWLIRDDTQMMMVIHICDCGHREGIHYMGTDGGCTNCPCPKFHLSLKKSTERYVW